MEKSLYDISWQVDESTYRADPALSYSILSKYEREGPENLEHLRDKISTVALTNGSAVDALITGNKKEFDDNFIIMDYGNLSDKVELIVKSLFNKYGKDYKKIDDIPDNIISQEAIDNKYYIADNYYDTRIRNIKKGDKYYSLLHMAGNKIMLSPESYRGILSQVYSLKNSEVTRKYFAEDNPFDTIRRYYQLKFKSNINGIDYRCMSDLLVVNYEKKKIIPVDLKTSGKPEEEFYKSFIQWRYSQK